MEYNLVKPKWRNWYTRYLEGVVSFACEGSSPSFGTKFTQLVVRLEPPQFVLLEHLEKGLLLRGMPKLGIV